MIDLVTIDGITPGKLKSLGENMMISYGFHSSPFGACLIGTTTRGICHLSFPDEGNKDTSLNELRAAWPNVDLHRDVTLTAGIVDTIFSRTKHTLKGNLSVFLVGTPFQLKVWKALLSIPFGHILSYQDVARAIGNPGSSRAVGNALAHNPVAYVIPCHRVIRATGIIGNYRWGSSRKQAMLTWEAGIIGR